MNARLFCKTGALADSEFQIGEEATIGRREQNDVPIPSEAVSGRHARIFFDDEAECYMLEDLDSSNGTRLDDTEVVEPVPLKDLHIITFAQKVDFIFQVVSEDPAATSADEGAKTQFGVAPESPSDLPGEEEPDGERTQFGGAPGALPDLPGEESTSEKNEEGPMEEEDRTRFGESPPELPDFSEQDESEEDRTRFGDAPGTLPDLSEEDTSSEQAEEPTGEEDRTQFGEAPGALPDLPEEESASPQEEEEASEEDRTRFGEAPGELPDLPEEESAGEPEEEGPAEAERTQFGEAFGEMPDLPEEESDSEQEEEASEEEDRTRFGEAFGEMPDLSEEDSSSEEEDTPDEASPSEAPTRAAPDRLPESGPPSPQYALQVVLESGPEDTHSLPEGEVTIGRSDDCDIKINDPGVSREHARLIVESGEVVVEDMGSKNFTFVDGDRLSGPTPLSPGSEVHLGYQVKVVLQRADS